MSILINDIKFTVRHLGKYRFSNSIIILTIAMLIAGLSVVYAFILGERKQWMPFPESDRLVKLWRTGERKMDRFPGDLYIEYANRLTSLDQLGALTQSDAIRLTEGGQSKTYGAAAVSVNLLSLIGIPPLKGRLFDEIDLDAEGQGSVILSEQMWREQLSADVNIVGRRLLLEDDLYVVVGVMPASIRTTRLAYSIDIWLPRRFSADAQDLQLFGRLKSGVTLAQARAEMNVLGPLLERTRTPQEIEMRTIDLNYQGGTVASLDKDLRRGSKERQMDILWIIAFGTVIACCVIGISCFNITNLLLARVNARARELAIRSAMGARRSHIVRLLLIESLLLSVFGGVAGLLVSGWIVEGLAWANFGTARFDVGLCFVASCGTVLLGVLLGLLPALSLFRTDLTRNLKEGGHSTSGKQSHRLRNFLVSSEVTMALVLCVVAGLLTRVYFHLHAGKLGFESEKMLVVRVDIQDTHYPKDSHKYLYAERVMQALVETSGVESVAVKMSCRELGSAFPDMITIAGVKGSEPIELTAGTHYGSAGLPVMFGMDLLRGRLLSPDKASATTEALVSESFIHKHIEGLEPIGVKISVGHTPAGQPRAWKTIVGVTCDRHPLTSYLPIGPEVFLDYRESQFNSSPIFVVRTTADAEPMVKPVHEIIQRLDVTQLVGQPILMADLLEQNASEPKEAMILVGILGGIGLFIALMGIYGVVAFSVQERTHEVGIRLAVGASRRDVLMLLIWQGARLIPLGVILGMLIGSSIIRGLPKEIFRTGISAFDPMTYVVIIGIVAFVGFLATFFPARRAAAMSPMEALRYE